MSRDEELPEGAGKFFRTIVLVGGSMAFACGGVAQQQDDDSNSENGTGGDGASAGGAGAGGTNTGGRIDIGTGGIATPGAGGDTSLGGIPLVEPGPFACPPEQWDCTGVPLGCSYQYEEQSNVVSYHLPDGCSCDTSRPLGVDDCQEGQVRTCLEAAIDGQGNTFTAAVSFACECVVDTPSEPCSNTCSSREVSSWGSCLRVEGEPADDVICGCELPILR